MLFDPKLNNLIKVLRFGVISFSSDADEVLYIYKSKK